MTTKQQPTPYDSKIEARPECDGFDTTLLLLVAQREGYLVAKAEDADLLAACKAALNLLLSGDERGFCARCGRKGSWGEHEAECPASLCRAAIAKAEGVTP